MPCDSSPVIDSLIKNIDQLSNDSVRSQVTLFCSTLNQYIKDLHIDSAPMFVDMDGEDVYFEWIFKDFRFGFFFFANNEDSAWGLTTLNSEKKVNGIRLIHIFEDEWLFNNIFFK